MYDSIIFNLVNENALSEFSYLKNKIEDARVGSDNFIGKLENLSVSLKAKSLNINGSISRFLNGNNLKALTISDTKEAIEKLSDLLGLDVYGFRVYRLHFTDNLELKLPVENYISCFGSWGKAEKSILKNGTSLRYDTGEKGLSFYDKGKEAKLRAKVNLMRYEMKFQKNISKHIKKKVSVNDLTDKHFFDFLLTKWYENYTMINKIDGLKGMTTNDLRTSKDIYNEALLEQVKSVGGKEKFIELLKSRPNNKISRQNFHSFKKTLDKLCEGYTEPIEAIKELDNEMILKVKEQKERNGLL